MIAALTEATITGEARDGELHHYHFHRKITPATGVLKEAEIAAAAPQARGSNAVVGQAHILSEQASTGRPLVNGGSSRPADWPDKMVVTPQKTAPADFFEAYVPLVVIQAVNHVADAHLSDADVRRSAKYPQHQSTRQGNAKQISTGRDSNPSAV